MTKNTHPSCVVYLAVLPAYRTECVRALRRRLGDQLSIYTSPSHLDPSVKTGIPQGEYEEVPLIRFGKVAFIQLGKWRQALAADCTLLDLNPRSLSAWLLLMGRRALGRRTVLWGHLHGREGPRARTAPLRSFMRRAADGFVAYTYSSETQARVEGAQPVWVAPNSLYSIAQLNAGISEVTPRTDAVYVGRFESEKKVAVAIKAFARLAQDEPEPRLILVGGGSQEPELRALVSVLNLGERVVFRGWINSFTDLKDVYASAFSALSPGFIGLGLTQSLGFGVPLIASQHEQHSPEVELAETGGVTWFKTDDSDSMADAMRAMYARRNEVPNHHLWEHIVRHYSADVMAQGIADALDNVPARRMARA